MPFNAAKIKITTSFTNATNMGLTLRTTGAFAAEGIATPADLAEFDKEGMESIFRIFRTPLKVLRAGAAGGCGELQEVIAYELDVSQFSVQYKYVLVARPAKARRSTCT